MLGYCDEQKAYKILVNNKIINARSVYFDETEFMMRKKEEQDVNNLADEQLMKSFKKVH